MTMDFKYFYPHAMDTFRTRWLVYKQNIEVFLEAELKDANCLKLLEKYQLQKLLEKYQLQKATINEDARSCVLIYLVHAITKPLRHFKPVNGNQVYAITDSQHSMTRLIRHKAEIDKYTEPYPCIFVVGNSLLEVQECYVAFMDLCYKLSYEDCLAVCVQLFTLFQVKDPQASECFWEFIRGYMFNIAKDKEKPNAVTENMISYLETAASYINIDNSITKN
ncbi:hypothetical protein DOY81_010012 [Sarcophaga bullata]|nr:hypothetical protein DOY81_010012 [Sarcophaga bullata]